ncbi:hypothetical protein FDH61_gp45 [Arthrobacter phage Preamble]|uniref:Uncharacterized protein n=1 Tax=Arthrobacter phage Preamble TaxID=1772310 RepID=A0A0U4JCY5_9CAUD|nr:hypothetical protein FDH61_gp45 [Arthrobacter phage Preamble]ALY09845.1 hypothetical protein PREAMBLE_45 [Arthrobacter phage Preamble]
MSGRFRCPLLSYKGVGREPVTLLPIPLLARKDAAVGGVTGAATGLSPLLPRPWLA